MATTLQTFSDRAEFDEYHTWREDHPNGFVIHVKGKEAEFVYHQASCSRLNEKSAKKKGQGLFNGMKVCSGSLPYLQKWHKRNFPSIQCHLPRCRCLN